MLWALKHCHQFIPKWTRCVLTTLVTGSVALIRKTNKYALRYSVWNIYIWIRDWGLGRPLSWTTSVSWGEVIILLVYCSRLAPAHNFGDISSYSDYSHILWQSNTASPKIVRETSCFCIFRCSIHKSFSLVRLVNNGSKFLITTFRNEPSYISKNTVVR